MANKQFNPTSEKRFDDCSEEEKEALYDSLNERHGHADWDKKLEKMKKQPEYIARRRLLDSPQFLDFMWKAIDISPELSNVKVILQKHRPTWASFVNDVIIDRSARLYLLSKKLEYVVGRSKTGKIHFKRWEQPRQFEKKIEKNLDSKDGHKQTMERTIVKALFNGTSLDFPVNYITGEYLSPVEIMENIDEQIRKNYKNISSSKLDTIFRTVAEMESKLSKKVDSDFQSVADEYELSKDQFAFNWFSMIRILLLNGRIKDDLKFGFLVIGPKGLDGLEQTECGLVALGYFNGTCVRFYNLTTKEILFRCLDEAIECINEEKGNMFDDVENVFDDMLRMEKSMNQFVSDGIMTWETYKKVAEIYKMDVETWTLLWFSYIRFLMKVGRIEEDENFGFEFETKEVHDEECAHIRKQRELAEKAEQAEKLRIQLEKEVEEQEHKMKLAKAEEKRKADEVKAKAKAKSKEASKRNIPPFPPNMKERGKQDSTMVCNKKAQLEWLKKHVPNWDGTLWNKKQANKYIDDIKKGIDVIVCDIVPVAEACGACNDDFEGLVHAEASTTDAYNL